MVANWAPTGVLMWVAAHSPKAAEPPVLFIRATTVPRATRKKSIPTLYESERDPMIPS